jgi:hypothetical protein
MQEAFSRQDSEIHRRYQIGAPPLCCTCFADSPRRQQAPNMTLHDPDLKLGSTTSGTFGNLFPRFASHIHFVTVPAEAYQHDWGID